MFCRSLSWIFWSCVVGSSLVSASAAGVAGSALTGVSAVPKEAGSFLDPGTVLWTLDVL